MSDTSLYELGSTADTATILRQAAGLTKQLETQQSAGGSIAMAKETDAIATLTKQLETLESAGASSKQPATADAGTELQSCNTDSSLGKRLLVHEYEILEEALPAAGETLAGAEEQAHHRRAPYDVLRDMFVGFLKRHKKNELPAAELPAAKDAAELPADKLPADKLPADNLPADNLPADQDAAPAAEALQPSPAVQDAASQKDVAAELAETKTQVEDAKTLLEDAKTRLDAANALLAMDLSTIAKLKDESSKLRLLVGSLNQERANLVQRNENMRQQLLRTQTDLVINHNIIHYLKQQPDVAAQLHGEWYERFDTPIHPLDTSSTGSAVPGDPGPAGGHH